MRTSKRLRKVEYLTLLLSFVMALPSCVLMNQETIIGERNIVTVRHENVKGITDIEASSIVEIKVIQSDVQFVEISANENIMPFVQMKQKGHKLLLFMDDKYQYKEAEILVKISTPRIDAIELSGAAEASFVGEWKSDNLSIRMSGATELKDLKANALETFISLSGATEFSGIFESKSTTVSMSGASEANVQLLNNDKCSLQLSGASNLEIGGNSQNLSLNASGSSDIEAKKLYAEKANIDLSGASSSKVYAGRQISYTLSGASSLDIYGDANVVHQKSSRTSSVTRHN